MTATDDVKEAFQGKRGKVLLIGGGVAIVGYVLYTRYNGQAEAVPADPDATEAVASDSGLRVPQTDPEVGNTSTGSTQKALPTTNAEWLADATDFLVGRGTPSSAAFNALNKALGGEPLTPAEMALVSQAISALRTPPEGMPPLQASTATTPGGAKLGAVTGLKATAVNKTSISWAWTKVAGAEGYNIYLNGVKRTPALFASQSIAGLKPNTSYTIRVAARKGTAVGPYTSQTTKTKK